MLHTKTVFTKKSLDGSGNKFYLRELGKLYLSSGVGSKQTAAQHPETTLQTTVNPTMKPTYIITIDISTHTSL